MDDEAGSDRRAKNSSPYSLIPSKFPILQFTIFKHMNFSTHAIHTGVKPDESTGAIIPPIYQTSTYIQESPGKFKGYDYTRSGNPNFTYLEETLASLEGGKYAKVFSSGLGATTTLISTLKQGDKVLATDDLYGGTHRLFCQVFNNFGIDFEMINTQNLDEVDAALAKEKPKWIFIESPTNPLLKICDIKAIAEIAKKHGVLSIVDNTFATPYFQKPLELGIDVVLHSTTKYIGGHSDIIGGAVISNDEELMKKLDYNRNAMGINPSPFDCWLVSRGVKTLAVRMDRHEENAIKVAEYFDKHPKVKKVYFPGLPSHENHDVAKKQMSGFGGMVSAEFNMSLEEAMKVISSFKVISLAESLGGIESLVDHPASMTHASIPKEEREKLGLGDGLIRFSIGIEDIDDLLNDLETTIGK